MHQVIYSSAAVSRFSEQDLATLLSRARANNERLGVSGLLLHHEGSFLQALEGDETVLDALFATISRDKRHCRIVKLLGREVSQRDFPDWKMGFVATSRAGQPPPGFSDFLRAKDDAAAAASVAERILIAFRGGRFRAHVS